LSDSPGQVGLGKGSCEAQVPQAAGAMDGRNGQRRSGRLGTGQGWWDSKPRGGMFEHQKVGISWDVWQQDLGVYQAYGAEMMEKTLGYHLCCG